MLVIPLGGRRWYHPAMGFLDRLGKVVRAEISAVVRPDARAPGGSTSTATTPPRATTTPPTPTTRSPLVTDVDAALRVLELPAEATLDAVRQKARDLSRHFHPKTRSADPEEVRAARLVLEAITEAQELLEEHLLPVAAVPPSTPPTAVVD